jgi:uncharacterized protein (TIGR02588 family)
MASPDQRPSGLTATPIETALGLLGTLAVVAIVLYLLLAGPRHDAGQPRIVVDLAPAAQGVGGIWVVPFTATNGSDAPAQQIQLEATLRQGERILQQSLASIDFLGGHSSAEGGFVFSQDPGGAELTARVQGFARP